MHYFLKFILGMRLYMFRAVPLYTIRSFSLYTQQWFMPYRFADSLRAGSGWNPDPARKLPENLCDIHGVVSKFPDWIFRARTECSYHTSR
jgi:hypothetical protein